MLVSVLCNLKARGIILLIEGIHNLCALEVTKEDAMPSSMPCMRYNVLVIVQCPA